MTAPEIPPPVQRRYSAGQIALIVIGIILLLPGACAVFFLIGMANEIRLSDPITQMVLVLWAFCFAVSAIGIWLIVVARKRARIPP